MIIYTVILKLHFSVVEQVMEQILEINPPLTHYFSRINFIDLP